MFKKVYCLFEQSGTFRDTFKELGYESVSYDLENKFGQTDNQLDLFKEIDNAYLGNKSIFDDITSNDLIVAFFPCTWFSGQNELIWSRKVPQFKKWDDDKVDDYIKERKKERKKVFDLLLKFIEVVKLKKIKTVIENPYTQNYLLSRKEIPNPSLIIQDRRKYGDNHIKPTMFYFINFEPSFMTDYIRLNNEDVMIHNEISGIKRSLMHKDFAFNFIRKYIIGI